MYNIITIERRYASGGNEIGKRLAEALGYKLYDRNILMEAAQKLDISAVPAAQRRQTHKLRLAGQLDI